MNTCKKCGTKIKERYYCAECNQAADDVVSTFEWLKWSLPCLIPVFGFIWVIITAFGKKRKYPIVSYARCSLIIFSISIVMGYLATIGMLQLPSKDIKGIPEMSSCESVESPSMEGTPPSVSLLENSLEIFDKAVVSGEKVIAAINDNLGDKIGIVVITPDNTNGRNYLALFGDNPFLHNVHWPSNEDYAHAELPPDLEDSYTPDMSSLKDTSGGDYIADADLYDSRLIRNQENEIVGVIFKQQSVQIATPPETVVKSPEIDEDTEELIETLKSVYQDIKVDNIETTTDNYPVFNISYAGGEGYIRKYASHDMAKLFAISTLLDYRFKNSGTAGEKLAFWYNNDPPKANYVCIAMDNYVLLLNLGKNSQDNAVQLIELFSSEDPTYKHSNELNRLESTSSYMNFVRQSLGGQFIEHDITQSNMVETLEFEAIGLNGVIENYCNAPAGVWAPIQQLTEDAVKAIWEARGDNYSLFVEEAGTGIYRLWLLDAEKFRLQIEAGSTESLLQIGSTLVKAAGALTVNWEEVVYGTKTAASEPESANPPDGEQVGHMLELAGEFPEFFKKYNIPSFDVYPTVKDNVYQWRGYLKDKRVACYMMYSNDTSLISQSFEADKALAARTGAQVESGKAIGMFDVATMTYTGSATYSSLFGGNFYCRLITYPEEKRDIRPLIDSLAQLLGKLYETQSENSEED